MNTSKKIKGVFAAAVTPIDSEFKLNLDDIYPLVDFLWSRGCHGALFFGTTGEGTSFSYNERHQFLKEVINVRMSFPDFIVLAGTGTPSLEETISLTKDAFALGVDGVVTLPPFYFQSITDEGLFQYYSTVIERAVPLGKAFLGYHIPKMSRVPLSLDLLARLKEKFPDRFAGIKDSSGSYEFMIALHEAFGEDLSVLTGNDKLLSSALAHSASGCITALSNFSSPIARKVYEISSKGGDVTEWQEKLTHLREILDKHPPAAPYLKAIMHKIFGFPKWSVMPPLVPIRPVEVVEVDEALSEVEKTISLDSLINSN